jgi:hypothetical protein
VAFSGNAISITDHINHNLGSSIGPSAKFRIAGTSQPCT